MALGLVRRDHRVARGSAAGTSAGRPRRTSARGRGPPASDPCRRSRGRRASRRSRTSSAARGMKRGRSTQSIEPQATTRSKRALPERQRLRAGGHVADPVRPSRVAQHVERGVDADDLLGQVEEGERRQPRPAPDVEGAAEARRGLHDLPHAGEHLGVEVRPRRGVPERDAVVLEEPVGLGRICWRHTGANGTAAAEAPGSGATKGEVLRERRISAILNKWNSLNWESGDSFRSPGRSCGGWASPASRPSWSTRPTMARSSCGRPASYPLETYSEARLREFEEADRLTAAEKGRLKRKLKSTR